LYIHNIHIGSWCKTAWIFIHSTLVTHEPTQLEPIHVCTRFAIALAPTGELESSLQTAESAVASLGAQLDAVNASLKANALDLVQQREELEEQLRMARQQLKVGFRLPLISAWLWRFLIQLPLNPMSQ